MAVGSVGHANRGKALEKGIEQANRVYRARAIAIVQQIAVPTKALAVDKTGRTTIIREKSTVDFYGAWAGRAIAFDAKENREDTRFPLQNVHYHQYLFLTELEDIGRGIGFLLVYQASDQAVYLLPRAVLGRYWLEWQNGGRASIPVDELRQLPKCRPGRGCTIDYLAALQEWLASPGGVTSCESTS